MRRRRRRGDPLAFAGWLFADLLLGFAVVVLGSSAGGLPGGPASGGEAAVVAEPTTTTTSTTPISETTTSTESTTTTQPKPAGVDLNKLQVEVPADFGILTGPEGPAREAELNRVLAVVDAQVAAAGKAGKRAALLITFGVHPSVGQGQVLADAFNRALIERRSDSFGSAVPRSFDQYSGVPGTVKTEIYFFTE